MGLGTDDQRPELGYGQDILTYKPSAALGARGIGFRWPANYPATPTATEMDSAQAELLNAPAPISGGGLSNMALSSDGASATASSYYNSGYGPGGTINGDRSGSNWGAVAAGTARVAVAPSRNGSKSILAARRASRRRSCTRYRTSFGRRRNRPIR